MRNALAIAALVLVAACASKPKVPLQPPDWESVPRVVLDAFCNKSVSEGISHEAVIHVYRQTRPLITPAAIVALHEAYTNRTDPEAAVLTQKEAAAPPLTLTIPTDGCHWRPIDRYEPARDADAHVLQLSNPIINPYSRGESGLFACLSIGNEAPQWYWIPVAKRNGMWGVGTILPIDLRD